jgi:hypothetical protein
MEPNKILSQYAHTPSFAELAANATKILYVIKKKYHVQVFSLNGHNPYFGLRTTNQWRFEGQYHLQLHKDGIA